ncbi:glutathione binding-like protein [Chelatococcus composti]|uniref:Glutathione S-transferase n=1 Tax=Chelatococcus composti TaxID=1743235 RepID=A0A841K6F7_9HYPH|nr:glutathione S-transferase [Chelatococcus composti]
MGALRGRRYIAGDRFSAADVYLASHLQWGMMVGVIEKRPEFEAYCAPLVTRPAALRADAEVKKLQSQKAWSAA